MAEAFTLPTSTKILLARFQEFEPDDGEAGHALAHGFMEHGLRAVSVSSTECNGHAFIRGVQFGVTFDTNLPVIVLVVTLSNDVVYVNGTSDDVDSVLRQLINDRSTDLCEGATQ